VNPHEIRQIGRYPVRRFIAEGGMAWVFHVVDPNVLNAPRALKMLKPGVAAGDQFRRFQDEAGILAHLDHQNLVTIYDFGFDETTGCHFYTMTLVDTPPLSQRGVLTLGEAGPIFLDVLAGLAKLHENGIIHRDIKPQNILIHPDGRAMLADLGIARTAEISEGDTWLPASTAHGTTAGVAIGTPAYMSPEQARAQRGITKATDVFSLGLTMYHALTGRTIYHEVEELDSRSGQEILLYLGHLSFSRKDFQFHFEDTPVLIQEVIQKACKIDPKDRYLDASAMLQDLEDKLDQVYSPPTKALRWIVVSGVLLAAVAVGGFVAWQHHHYKVLLEAASNLERQAADVFQVAETANPATSPEILSAANEKRRWAETLLQTGRENHEGIFLENASNAYIQSCQKIVEGDLTARFSAAADEVKRSADALRTLKVGDLAPDDWAKFETLLAALAPPGDTRDKCDLAKSYQVKFGEIRLASDSARALEQQLQKEWPRLAEAARDDAYRSENELPGNLSTPEFQEAFDRGKRSLVDGDSAMKIASYLPARDAYNKAKDSFSEARVIADAYHAQQLLRELQSEAKRANVVDPATEREITQADQLYATGKYAEARTRYEDVSKFLRTAIDNQKMTEGARVSRQAAEEARNRALAAGAEKSANSELANADLQLHDADSKFNAGRFEEARQAYAAAASSFQVVSQQTSAALEDARNQGRDARSAGRKDCKVLPQEARPKCEEAQAELAEGDAAVEAHDAPKSRLEYDKAKHSFADVEGIIKHVNVPPRIVSKRPASQQYEAHTGDSLHFEIVAKDPNADDVLHYVWTVDQHTRPENGTSLDLRADTNSTVAVRVDDGHPDGVVTESWNVVIKNRPPKLSLSPATDVSLKVDERKTFVAQASDPDGDEVVVDFLLDHKPVGHGGANFSYVFEAPKEGTFDLEARATDAKGAVTSVERKIAVHMVSPPAQHPTLTLSPSEEELTIQVGDHLSFRADVRPSGTPVAFVLDGRRVSNNSSYEFAALSEGKHSLEVRAGEGSAVALQKRQIVVESRPITQRPTLTLSPSEEELTVQVGDHLSFRADVRPAGTPVSFVLDGRPVSNNSSYEFAALSEGKHSLEVRAGEGSAVALQKRQIVVEPRPMDLDKEAATTMSEYATAYEHLDIDRLKKIWEMDSNQISNTSSFFQSIHNLSISIKTTRVQPKGDQISVEFDQTIVADGRQTPRAPLVATLVKNPSGSGWKIEKIGPR
jgi:serine/threonine-protein kinase